MKKSSIVVFVILSIFLSGTANAAINGYSSGYPIVQIKVNGQKVHGDTPAILFNGRTMVPLAFVVNALGAAVTWDAATETAVITTKAATTDNTELVKYYNEVGNYYIRLRLLSEYIESMYDGLNIATEGILSNLPEGTIQLSKMNTTYAGINESYAYRFTEAAPIIRGASKYGIGVTDINIILAKQKEAIQCSNNAYKALNQFVYSRNSEDFSFYLSNQARLKALCVETSDMALEGYRDFYLLIQNY